MSGRLTLPSIEIRGYRGIRELRVDRLGRANLIVGKNNVGKTSFLEALALLARPGDAEVLLGLLGSRDELFEKWMIGGRWNQVPVQKLFHGRTFSPGVDSISIGTVKPGADRLTIRTSIPRIDFDIRDGVIGWWEVPDSAQQDRQLVLEFEKAGRVRFLPIDPRRPSGFPVLPDSRDENFSKYNFLNYYRSYAVMKGRTAVERCRP